MAYVQGINVEIEVLLVNNLLDERREEISQKFSLFGSTNSERCCPVS